MKRDFSEFSLRLGGSDGKESACNVGDQASIPGSGRSLGEINVNPLHYSCLENSMDRGAWWATHSTILAWKIPLTEEHGGLQSMGSQRVGHN